MSEDLPPPECNRLAHLFYGPEEDGRAEKNRRQREAMAKSLCFRCPYRKRCLLLAVTYEEPFGVWGGMTEGERREFVKHLKEEGFTKEEPPTQDELNISLRQFYRNRRSQQAG